MDKQWKRMAALTVSVALSACGGGTDNSTDPALDGAAQPSKVVPADPVASTPSDPVADLLSWLASQPASPTQAGAFFLDTTPSAGAFTVLGPAWLSGAAHQLVFGVRGQLTADTTATLAVLPSTPTHDLFGGADLVIGRIDGDVKVGNVASSRQFSYVAAKPSSSLPDTGIVSYSLSQATSGDVRVSGNTVPAAAHVTITAATLTANFAQGAAAPVTLTLTGTLGDKTYAYTLPVGQAAQIDRSAASFKADNGSGTVLTGVFTGSNATQVGVHYTITIDGGSLDGSLILQKP
jgi:hypothetical protein